MPYSFDFDQTYQILRGRFEGVLTDEILTASTNQKINRTSDDWREREVKG
jgi:hypothetical protein